MIKASIQIGKRKIENRVVLQPMEGCDCNLDGSPSELTVKKYRNAAKSGAGIVWFEANTVCPEGRTNARQMMLTKENLPAFKTLLREMAKKECGVSPIFILQLTHSGRQSIVPMIAYRHPIYEERRPATDDHIVTDAYLDTLAHRYAESARLAVEAGFDGVDVKSCHASALVDRMPNTQNGARRETRTITRGAISTLEPISDIPDPELWFERLLARKRKEIEHERPTV